MSPSSFSHAELFELLARQEEGDATAHDRLRDMLYANSEARKYYLTQMQLTAHLCWTIGQVDCGTASLTSQPSQRTNGRAQKRTVVMAGLTSAWSKLSNPSRVLAVGIPTLLLTYFSLLMLSVIWDRAHPASTHRYLASPQSAEHAVAVVTNAADVRWSSDSSARSEDLSIRMGEQLKIDSGIVELKLDHGAHLSVQGPAQWSIDGDNAVSLKQGTLVARVPAQAVGFTVATPTTKIIDLGTEFGVEVDATGRTDVQVLEGAVNVDYPSLDDKSKSARRSVRMTAGSAKRFGTQLKNADVVTATEIAPWLDKTSRIVKRGGQQQALSAETKYAAAVLADRPLGYWRFSDTDVHRAVDASGHRNHGEYLGFVSTNNPGICPSTSDRSIRFLGKSYGGYVRIKDFELPASCTVELWARSATPSWNTFGWLLHCASPNGFEICPQSGRDWHVMLRNAREEGHQLGPHKPTNITDRFHQYAFSYDAVADRGSMYFDGTLVQEKANLYGNDLGREAARLTFYLGRPDPLAITPEIFWGEGSIDELSIYGKVLTPDGVKRHYDAAECSKPISSNSGGNHD